MMKKKLWVPLSVVFVLCLLLVGVGLTKAGAFSGQPSGSDTGAPAIPVTQIQFDPAQPAFTVEDVRQYVTTHPLPRIESSNVTVASITFEKVADVRALLEGAPNLPDSTLVCLVELNGSFAIESPIDGSAITYPHAYEIFDAHTGSLLVAGARP
jgi:hypothetical protein